MVAFLSALLLTHVIGSALAAQVILTELRAMGLPVGLRTRLLAAGHDVLALGTSYLPVLLPGLAAACALAALLGRWLPGWRPYLYPLFAALSVVGLHLGCRALLGFNLLAAARHDHGLALQALAGWIGGYAFYVFMGLARR
jgi:hypothetical protein